MKKLSFLQAYEKHIDKVRKHGLTIASVLAVGVVGSLGYQGYQDASYAKAIANTTLLQDMGFLDTPIKVAPVKSIKDVIAIDDPIDTVLTGVYTGGDIIISTASFTQTLPNGTVGPINTILSTGSNAPVNVNITFKNIGTKPLYIPVTNINGNNGHIIMSCQGPSVGGGCLAKVSISSLTQGRYLLAGQSIQGTITNSLHGGWFGYPYTNTSLTFTVNSQQEQGRSPIQPSQYQSMLFESNGQNNTFTINYTVPSTPTPISTGVIYLDSQQTVKKGFDLTIKDITSTYNQSDNTIKYNFKLKNIGNKTYNPNISGGYVYEAERIMINKVSNNQVSIGLIGTAMCNYFTSLNCELENLTNHLGFYVPYSIISGGSRDFSFKVTPSNSYGGSLGNGNYSICNTIKIGLFNLIEANNSNILPNDINVTNNSTEYCTTFTKTNGTNPPTGSGNTYGYGYGYQPGYGYGYGYGYKTKYTDKSNFFYLTKPYMMISEKIYKVFKDQHKVMKKLTKGAVEKLFDKSTLRTMKTDVMKYLKKEINKAQNKTKGMREKIAEIQKISKLYTQFIKDYGKRISAKETTKTYIKPTDTKKEATKTYTKSTDIKKEVTKTYDNVYGYKKTTN